MMLPEGENVLLLKEDEIQDLRAARNRTRVPQSLYALAIQSVAEHFTRFTDVPDSPLKYLSNATVQQLLSKMSSDVRNKKMLMSIPLKKKVLDLLVNPSITELDFNDIECIGLANDQMLSKWLFSHVLKNCPKIRKIELTDELNKTGSSRPKFDDLPVVSFKGWKNLTTIICSKKYICNEDTIVFLQENFPNIEELAVSIRITDGPTAQTVLDHLIKMKSLHTLNLLDVVAPTELYDSLSIIRQFIFDVAGGVPSLQCFGFAQDDRNYASNFIDLFGEKYPYKKLLVDKLRIDNHGLKGKWPKNLIVKHLTIKGYLNDAEIENLSTIDFMLDLTVDCKFFHQTYKVLDCMGRLVHSLAIREQLYYDTEFILERILAACPNLEHFKLEIRMSVAVQDPNYYLSPSAFKNYKSFEIDCSDEKYLKEVALQEVYLKFLIGTEVCETLELMLPQLEALAQVALEYPESLQQLRELHTESRVSFANNSSNDDVLVIYDKCFYELLTCCHKLERIIFRVDDPERVKKQKPKTPYDFTIQKIDPHFIKYNLNKDGMDGSADNEFIEF